MADRASGPTTWYRVGTLIDGTRDVPLEDAAIAVSGDRISWCGSRDELREGQATGTVVDLSDHVVMPGFVDVHTHFTLFADRRSYEDMATDSDELMLLAGADNARRHLHAGVTTARDNGSRNGLGTLLREGIRRGVVPGPRLLVSGRPVTKPGGHFHFCNGVADDEDDVRKAVAQLVEEGVDHIKIMASGGGTVGTDPTAATYSVKELRAAVETAHRADRLTTAHCRAIESMKRAVEAGVDCMEHAEFLRPDGQIRYDEDLALRLLASEIYVSPTLAAWHYDTILELRELVGRDGATHEQREQLAELEADMKIVLEIFGRMLDSGLKDRLVGGTDAGCFDVTFGHIEYSLDLMVQGGMTEMEAIKASTSLAARAIGVDSFTGSLEPGKMADLVVLKESPLADIKATGEVAAVCQEGNWVFSHIPELG